MLAEVVGFHERGVLVVPWQPDEPVTTVIEAVKRLRQSVRRAVR